MCTAIEGKLAKWGLCNILPLPSNIDIERFLDLDKLTSEELWDMCGEGGSLLANRIAGLNKEMEAVQSYLKQWKMSDLIQQRFRDRLIDMEEFLNLPNNRDFLSELAVKIGPTAILRVRIKDLKR